MGLFELRRQWLIFVIVCFYVGYENFRTLSSWRKGVSPLAVTAFAAAQKDEDVQRIWAERTEENKVSFQIHRRIQEEYKANDLEQSADEDQQDYRAEQDKGRERDDVIGDSEHEDEDNHRDTIAHVLEEALKEEFKHEEEKQAEVGKQFNQTVSREEGKQETVVIISQKNKEKVHADDLENDSESHSDGLHDFAAHADQEEINENLIGTSNDIEGETKDQVANLNGSSLDSELQDNEIEQQEHDGSTSSLFVESDVDRIIDSHDNEYVLSKPNEEGSMGLTIDPQLIRDLSLLVSIAALAGMCMEALGQPAINGYFVAGSLVGPGGLGWIKETVQVQSVAQIGVQLLLFILGLELSASKLRAVRDVAIIGGILEVVAMAALGGAAAAGIGAGSAQGAFIGALLAMSSTSIVIKCLQETRVANYLHGQITIGTLVLQDCLIGLLFAFMPVLAAAARGGSIRLVEFLGVAGRVLMTLSVTAAIALAAASLVLPSLVRVISRSSSETFQMASLGFCFFVAMVTTRLGISGELGAFLAGVMLSATEQNETILHAVEPIMRFFLALFVASTGVAIAPWFLAEHFPVLAAGVAVVVAAKSLVVAGVVLLFRYPLDTALAVGINLAQVGEFAFVLLSLASQQHVIGTHVYLLLMGVTALSLLITPLLLQLSAKLVIRPRSQFVANGNPSSDLELATPPPTNKARTSGTDVKSQEKDDDYANGRGNRFGTNTSVSRRSSSAQGR